MWALFSFFYFSQLFTNFAAGPMPESNTTVTAQISPMETKGFLQDGHCAPRVYVNSQHTTRHGTNRLRAYF